MEIIALVLSIIANLLVGVSIINSSKAKGDSETLQKRLRELREKIGIDTAFYNHYLDDYFVSNSGVFREIMDDIEDIRNEDLAELKEKVDRLFVDNYFSDCPCCLDEEEIFIGNAVEFEKVVVNLFNVFEPFSEKIGKFYTTEEQYEAHKSKIEDWKEEVEELREEN